MFSLKKKDFREPDSYKWVRINHNLLLLLLNSATHFASDVFLDQMVLSFVVKNDVHFLGAVAADVRTWGEQK